MKKMRSHPVPRSRLLVLLMVLASALTWPAPAAGRIGGPSSTSCWLPSAPVIANDAGSPVVPSITQWTGLVIDEATPLVGWMLWVPLVIGLLVSVPIVARIVPNRCPPLRLHTSIARLRPLPPSRRRPLPRLVPVPPGRPHRRGRGEQRHLLARLPLPGRRRV